MNNDKTLVEGFKKENPIRIFYKGALWIKIYLNWKILNLRAGDFENGSQGFEEKYSNISWKIFMRNILKGF